MRFFLIVTAILLIATNGLCSTQWSVHTVQLRQYPQLPCSPLQEETRHPWSGAQSGSHIYQSPQTLSESKFAKIQSSHFQGRGGFRGNQFPTFVAESKFAKIQTNFQLLLLSPNLLKSKVPIYLGGGGFPWKPISYFCC